MLCNEFVECREVSGFLVIHVLHEGSEVGMRAYDLGCLRGIDERRGKFAGLVDSECAVQVLSLFLAQNVCGLRGSGVCIL